MSFKESLTILYKTRANILLDFRAKILLKIIYIVKGLKDCKFTQKVNKAKYAMKKIFLKGNRTTKYIKYKHKNTGASVAIYPRKQKFK